MREVPLLRRGVESGELLAEAFVRSVPILAGARRVICGLKGIAHDLARLVQRTDFSQAQCLYHEVADCGGLDWPRNDGPLRGVGCKLAQQLVLNTAADDVNAF